jgi:hypothetical protein
VLLAMKTEAEAAMQAKVGGVFRDEEDGVLLAVEAEVDAEAAMQAKVRTM